MLILFLQHTDISRYVANITKPIAYIISKNINLLSFLNLDNPTDS